MNWNMTTPKKVSQSCSHAVQLVNTYPPLFATKASFYTTDGQKVALWELTMPLHTVDGWKSVRFIVTSKTYLLSTVRQPILLTIASYCSMVTLVTYLIELPSLPWRTMYTWYAFLHTPPMPYSHWTLAASRAPNLCGTPSAAPRAGVDRVGRGWGRTTFQRCLVVYMTTW